MFLASEAPAARGRSAMWGEHVVPITQSAGPNLTPCRHRRSKLFALRDAYWITSSAVANSVSGMVRPSALAVVSLSDPLFDDIVGDSEQRGWHLDAERPGRWQVDDELEFGRLHHREFGGLLALEDPTGIDA